MANKRKPLTFPELDDIEPKPKGRRAILRSVEEVEAEKQIIDRGSQQTGIQENQETSIPESQEAGNRNRYPKVTYRLSPDAIDAIDEAKRLLRRRYDTKVSLEEIAEEAILQAYNDLLENQYTSNLVNKLSGKQKDKKASN